MEIEETKIKLNSWMNNEQIISDHIKNWEIEKIYRKLLTGGEISIILVTFIVSNIAAGFLKSIGAKLLDKIIKMKPKGVNGKKYNQSVIFLLADENHLGVAFDITKIEGRPNSTSIFSVIDNSLELHGNNKILFIEMDGSNSIRIIREFNNISELKIRIGIGNGI